MAATDLSNAPSKTTAATTSLPKALGGGVSNLDATIAAKSGVGSDGLQFPQDRAKYYTAIGIYEYSRSNFTAIGDLTPAAGLISNKIYLPLPMDLVDSQSLDYQETPLGVFAGSALSGLQTAMANPTLGNLATTGLPFAGQVGYDLINATTPGQRFLSAASAMSGVAPNEFYTVLFKRPLYKVHELKFKLSPQNFNEAVTIRKIINTFNKAAAPGMTQDQSLFTFPKILRIAYAPNPGYVYKFKPSVIKTVSINYAGGGSPAFYRDSKSGGFGSGDNPPESVDIVLQLQELEYWITDNFKDTNNAQDGEMMNGGGTAQNPIQALTNFLQTNQNAPTPTISQLTGTTL